MTAFPKEKRVKDKKYLAWCRKQPCAFCGETSRIQAHHTILKSRRGALRDDTAVSACMVCHARCHAATLVNGKPPIGKAEQVAAATVARSRFLDGANYSGVPW